jgi:hypothetical protein
MLSGNLAQALHIAIENQTEAEKEHGFTSDSAFVAGLKEVLAAVQREERIEIIRGV